MSPRKSAQAARQNGAVLVEFGIVVPVLILFLTLMLNYGRIISQLSWLNQAAYEVLLAGIETSVGARQAAMDKREQDMIENYKEMSNTPRQLGAPQISENFSAASDIVSVKAQGQISTLIGAMLSLPLQLEISGPVLVADAADVGNLTTPANPIELYDCDGMPCSGAGTCPSSCLSCDSGPGDVGWPCH